MFRTIPVIFTIFVFSALAMAQHPQQERQAAPSQPSVIAPENVPSVEEYKEALDQFKKWTEKFDDLKTYEEVVLSRGEDGRTKFVDLPEVDQYLFIILSGQNCSNAMMKTYHQWKIERKQILRLDVLRQDGQADQAREGEVTPAQLATFMGDLKKIQKKHAKKFERTILKILERHKGDIPKKDGHLYLENVRKFHDRFGLIDRERQEEQ